MKALWIQGKGILLAPFFLILFVFFVPVSPTLKSVFLIASVICILLTPDYNKHLLYAFNTLWGRAAMGLIAFVIIASFWSEAPYSMRWMVVEKYIKVIYLPILAVGFIHPRVRNLCLNSYLFSIYIICIISILKSKGLWFQGDPGEVFYNHIITGFMVAFGSYIAGLFVFQSKGKLQILYLVLFLLTSYQVLFINTGRTGYVVYFILVTLLILQQLSFKKAGLALILFSGLMTIVYTQSPIMQAGAANLLHDIKSMQQNNENTSLGYRVQFHHYAKTLLATHPIIGIGTGGFKYSFSKDQPVPSWGVELNEPHSQYWMTLAEQGIVGLVFLVLFLGSLFIASFQLTKTKPILLGILAAFTIGAFSDTILCYSPVGFLLIIMSAISLGELIEQRVTKKSEETQLFSVNNLVSAGPIC